MSAAFTLVSHDLCPYAQRAAIAFHEKGTPCERVMIDLSDKPAWFLALSPTGKVPLLRVTTADGGEAVLFESHAICEYIEETQPGAPLHSADPLARAEHRAWMEYGSAILSDIYGLETTKDAGTFELKRTALRAKFTRLEERLGDGPFFDGPRFGLVDVVFAPVFRYFDVFDEIADLGIFGGCEKIAGWRAVLSGRASVIAAVAKDYPEKLRAFLQRHDAYMLSLNGQRLPPPGT